MIMWEHQGKCPCGKKSYLFGQCPKCLKEEQLERSVEEQEENDPTPAPAEPSSQVEIEIPAGPLKLPDVLQTPVVRTGVHTQHVEFITDQVVHRVRRGELGWEGQSKVSKWNSGDTFPLPASPSRDVPFRMCFVIESTGDVIPLQQCVDTKFETLKSVPASAWLRNPGSLVGVWEPTPQAV